MEKTADDITIVNALSSVMDSQAAILRSLAVLTEGKLASDQTFMVHLLEAIDRARVAKEYITELQAALDDRIDSDVAAISEDIIRKAKED